MEIANLPSEILMEIFRRLPLGSQIKLGRTCKRLQSLSMLAISETECLDVADKELRKITRVFSDLKKLLGRCANKVERIRFPSEYKDVLYEEEWSMIRAICAFSYPKLEVLILPGAPMGDHVFADVVKQCPTLKSLTWNPRLHDEIFTTICPDTISKSVLTARLGKCAWSFVRTVAERCPNLTSFQFGFRRRVTAAKVDLVFARCKKVEELASDLQDAVVDDIFVHAFHLGYVISAAGFVHFWTLSSLRSLTLNAMVDDSMLVNIARHFRLLRDLTLPLADRVTSIGYASLATLSDLRRLIVDHFSISNDTAIRQLAAGGRLEEVRLTGVTKLFPTTFLSFVHSCADLRRLSIRTLKNVDSAAIAVEVVRGMLGRERDLDIEFFDTSRFTPWAAEEVRKELDDVNRSNGSVIRVTPKMHTGRFRWYD